MDPNTIKLLLQLVALASQLAPVVISQIEGIKQQTGKTADEIFAEAGAMLQANDAKALQILAELMTPVQSEAQAE